MLLKNSWLRSLSRWCLLRLLTEESSRNENISFQWHVNKCASETVLLYIYLRQGVMKKTVKSKTQGLAITKRLREDGMMEVRL